MQGLYGLSWRGELLESRSKGGGLLRSHAEKADLREAVLQNADLRQANFSEATLEGANLQGALLKRAKNLRPEQLATVETLYQADLDPSLKEKIKQQHAQLLNAPAVAPPAVLAMHVAAIESPEDNTEVGAKIAAAGKIYQRPLKGHLWLAAQHGSLIWPKDPEVPVTGSDWAVTVYEEGTSLDGKLTLALYLVQDEGDQWIRKWLSIGNATGTFPGLRKIPGSRLLDNKKPRMPSTDNKPRPDFLDRCAK